VYRALLILLPTGFRGVYGREMVDLLACRMAEAPSARARIGVWAGSVLDLLVESFSERVRGGQREASSGRGATMEGFLLDTRQSVRALLRTPGFTLIAVLTIGLGIGATTAIFSVLNGVVLRPLPFTEPDRLAMVWMDNQRIGMRTDITSWPTFEDWRRESRSFERMAGFQPIASNLAGELDPERVTNARVSMEFFDVMGVRPVVGRTFTEEEMAFGGPRVALIGQGVWERWFGESPSAVGSVVRLDGDEVRIVGVMPERFSFPERAQVWTPLWINDNTRQNRGGFFLYVVGRLADGANQETAQAEMDGIAASLAEQYPATSEGMGVYVQPLHEHLSGDLRTAVVVLFGAVVLVLLIACANVANLLLSRALSRQHETATRVALGARRGRLLRQSLVESLALALLGCGVGIALAYGGLEVLRATAPADLPRLDEIELDAVVLAFALVLSLATGLVFGIAPSLHQTSRDITSSLRDESRGTVGARAGWRLRSVLIVSELALSLVLLVGAGLLVQSFVGLASIDSDVARQDVLTARVTVEGPDYGDEEVRSFFARLQERLNAIPGVEMAAMGADITLPLLPNSGIVTVEGQPQEPNATRVEVTFDAVTPGYFEAIGTPILAGRDFTAEDRADTEGVVIVNEAMARRYWPNESPLGKRFRQGGERSTAPWLTVVGVTPDWRRTSPDMDTRPSAYMPHSQRPQSSMTVVLRAASEDPLSLAGTVRSAVNEIDPDQTVAEFMTLRDLLGERIAERRLVTVVAGLFAVVAVLLALVGVYGVLSYSVAQSTREIGVRIALGGDVPQVLGMVYKRVGGLVAAGLGLGVAGALVATRALQPLLYEVSSLDLMTFLIAPVLLGAVAMLACFVPARRATRVDPAVALRADA
jgi:putative ABC transport system permease protein